MKLLFVCNQNKNRSKTAEEMFKICFRSAGIYVNLKKEDIEWADIVCVMEEFQRKEIADKFPKQYLKKRIINLKVPDVYNYNPELIEVLNDRIDELLNPIIKLF